ncbi:MAG: hypothetical protein IH947_06315 [Bacteroidetes bacterium]|nr:hypothetical protein [Bacteroidota bacterium]
MRLKKGIRNGTDEETLRSYMLDFWENQLKFYFTNEEQVLPLMKRTQPSTHRFLTDHAYIQNLVSRITDKDIDINKGAADLTHRIDDHIRFEKGNCFLCWSNSLQHTS